MMVVAAIAFFGVFYFAVQLEKNNKPPENMHLPSGVVFGKADVDENAEAVKDNSLLKIQNLGTKEVSMMLTDIIADTLTFDSSDFKSVVAKSQKYFTSEGYGQYMQFVTNSGFETSLAQQDLQSGAYIDGEPVELNRGVYGDAFKWVFEVPVTISLIPKNAETYRNDQTRAVNRQFLLRAQLARVNDPQDPNAVKIELWQVLPPRAKK